MLLSLDRDAPTASGFGHDDTGALQFIAFGQAGAQSDFCASRRTKSKVEETAAAARALLQKYNNPGLVRLPSRKPPASPLRDTPLD